MIKKKKLFEQIFLILWGKIEGYIYNYYYYVVEEMFRQGAIKEVENFSKLRVKKELPSNKIIGINEIRDYLKGKITLIKAKELIIQKTRQYSWGREYEN